MSDHVTHRIVFDARHAEYIFSKIGNGTMDFNYFIPQPKHLYTGTIRSEDDAIDFPCNQSFWYQENWGTPYNASHVRVSVDGVEAHIEFKTRDSVPYPVLAAFCNRFQIPFTHYYTRSGLTGWYWREQWDGRERTSKQQLNGNPPYLEYFPSNPT